MNDLSTVPQRYGKGAVRKGKATRRSKDVDSAEKGNIM